MTTKETKELAPIKPQDTSLSTNMTVDALVSQRALITEAMQKVMKRDVDFGRIGGGDKDSLLQPGAQKLCMVFRLAPLFESREIFDGNHLTIKSTCTIRHSPTGMVLGCGEGLCTTKEKKYAKRKESGRVVDNANLPDQYNTVLKMANKRALVAAVLNVTAAGDIFTQDLADEKDEKEEEPLVVVDKDEPAPKPAPTKTEESPAQAKTNANGSESAVETRKIEKEKPLKWKGRITEAEVLELPDGKPAWALHGADGEIFKTAEEKHTKDGIEANVEYEITYHKNGKGTFVVDKIRALEVA